MKKIGIAWSKRNFLVGLFQKEKGTKINFNSFVFLLLYVMKVQVKKTIKFRKLYLLGLKIHIKEEDLQT